MNHPDTIRKNVSASYTRAVEQPQPTGGCCCSGPIAPGVLTALAGYGYETLAGLPPDAVQNSFGCGNPVALSGIRRGDTVLDLGSGAGIDLLLADVVLPDLDGPELAKRLLEHRPGLKVAFMSGYPAGMAGQISQLQDAAHIDKPFSPEQLLGFVRRALDAAQIEMI